MSNILLLRVIAMAENGLSEAGKKKRKPRNSTDLNGISQTNESLPNDTTEGALTQVSKSKNCPKETGQGSRVNLKKQTDLLRRKRNFLAHGMDVSPLETLACCQALKDLVGARTVLEPSQYDGQLECVEGYVELLKSTMLKSQKKTFTLVACPSSKNDRSCRVLLSPPKDLIGRDYILSTLTTLLTNPHDSEDVDGAAEQHSRRVLLHGHPGVGKTAVIRELAQQLVTSHPHQSVFQATTESTLLADIKLFLEEYRSDREGIFAGSLTDQMREHLLETKTSHLLIFEDVLNPQTVMSFLPTNKHCAIFTSPNDLSWRKECFVPGQVTPVLLEGLSEDDSLRLVESVLLGNNRREMFAEICREPTRKQRLLDCVSKDLQGIPLAIRLVSFQVCQHGLSAMDSLAIENEAAPNNQRSRVDEKAAGRVHVRGFYHVVRYALSKISPDSQALTLCFALSLLSASGTPNWFLSEICRTLKLSIEQEELVLNSLIISGLVMRCDQIYTMHQVVQGHVRVVAPCLSETVKDNAIAAVGRAIHTYTIKSTEVMHGAHHSSSHTSVQGLFDADTTLPDPHHVDSHLEQLIISFLGHAEQLELSWKQRDMFYVCLQWCYQRRLAYMEIWELDQQRHNDFVCHQEEIDQNSLGTKDRDEASRDLAAKWKYGQASDHVSQICADINNLSIVSSSDLMELLSCASCALLYKGKYGEVISLFEQYGYSCDSLVTRFEVTGCEVYLSSALLCAHALACVGHLSKATSTLYAVIKVWLPKSKTLTVKCHEEIMRSALWISRNLCGRERFGEALELCEMIYESGNMGHCRLRTITFPLLACRRATQILLDMCQRLPRFSLEKSRVWLHRVALFSSVFPEMSAANIGFVIHTFYNIYLVACLVDSTESPLALVASQGVEFCRRKIDETGWSFHFDRNLDEVVCPLLIGAGSVCKEDFNTEFVVSLCRRMAQIVREPAVSVQSIHDSVFRYYASHKKKSDFEQRLRCALFRNFCQYLVNPSCAFVNNPFAKSGKQRRCLDMRPDPSLTRQVVDMFAKELRLCGKAAHSSALLQAFRSWNCEPRPG